MSSEVYEAVLLIDAAMYIMCSEKLCRLYLQEATDFLKQFIKKAEIAFGGSFLTPATHLMLHLPLAAKRFGSVEKVSIIQNIWSELM